MYSGTLPTGTLLLNMLIKDEEEHLNRTLPQWARIISAWVIGVDDANSDASREVIQQHLGHIPGQIVTVHFDGMGPTWSRLCRKGVELFPGVTHGILADADFAPRVETFAASQLDVRQSKHLFSIWNEAGVQRKLDWIYRNVKGVHVERRTHQVLRVPPLPGQQVFMTEVSLHLDEQAGGYQDRTGGSLGKINRYIGFLAADLEDLPGDSRTLYYLGIAYMDKYLALRSEGSAESAEEALGLAVEYMKRRAAVGDVDDPNNVEELWMTHVKLGEVYERWLGEWTEARQWYERAEAIDPARAEPSFYIGQHLALHGDPAGALPFLHAAAALPRPQRSVFMWHDLYTCFTGVELARALVAVEPAVAVAHKPALQLARKALKRARRDGGCCAQRNPREHHAIPEQQAAIKQLLRQAKQKQQERLAPVPSPLVATTPAQWRQSLRRKKDELADKGKLAAHVAVNAARQARPVDQGIAAAKALVEAMKSIVSRLRECTGNKLPIACCGGL